MAVRELTDTSELESAVLLGFVARGCGPCVQQRPIWEALSETVVVVDVDEHPDLRVRYGIEGLPTTVVLGPVPTVLRGLQTTRLLSEALPTPA
jgi:thiol-disulfide isomerase/thioredoxin